MGFCLATPLCEPETWPNPIPVNVKHAALNGETRGAGRCWPSHHLFGVGQRSSRKKLGIHLEIEVWGQWGMVQSISAQGRMAQSVQMPAVFLRGHSDWFPPWQSAATTPMLVFKCLVYGSQSRGWVYPSKQLQFKWHFKTNSWHLSGREANGFMNTKLLFINITWIHICGIYSLFGTLPWFQRTEESWQRRWGEESECFNSPWRDWKRL